MATLTLAIKARTAVTRTFVDAAVSTANDTVTVPSHGFAAGTHLRFTNSGGALPTGLTANALYYVVSPTEHTFKVATTAGGSAVDISAASGGGTHTLTVGQAFKDLVPDASNDKLFLERLRVFLQGVQNGAYQASIDVHQSPQDPVAASGTITLASVAAADTVTIGGVTLTASATPSGEAQFSQAGTDAQDAASLASIINAHSTLGRLLTATSALGVVTVTCKTKGLIGNLITLAKTNSAITLSGTALTGGLGGSNGTAVTYGFGK